MARWEFLLADADERARFCGLAATLALPHETAAPANRRRSVLRLRHGDRTWFLKCFGRPQWKNRWRFLATPPRARDDAEREALVTLALRSRGVATPRPVAHGAGREGSYYLCAALPGEPLCELLRRGAAGPGTCGQLARFCGGLLGEGFHLPDLSAEHVFVLPAPGGVRFGLLDLHNGAVRAPGPAPAWLLRRVLRHFARSVASLPVPRARALAFALRLLRAAGRGRDARAILQRLPPFETVRRYEAAGRSRAYAARNPRRAARELRLLARVWPGTPGETVLDVPCGAGRLLPFLRARQHRVLWADAARAMLHEAARSDPAPPPALLADALALPLPDRACDGVVAFRFLHHLPRARARLALAEACRVARRFVVLSFFHPCSAHHLQRRLAAFARRGTPSRHALTLGRLVRWCRAHGFRLHAHAAELPFARELWVASFVRE